MPVCPKCHEANPALGARCPRDGYFYVLDEALEASADDRRIGTMVGEKYVIVGAISEGGMGSVYRAMQLPVERQVALKVLRADLRDSEHGRDRFIQEARAVSRLTHPNIITLHDFGFEQGGQPYMVMEYAPGTSLLQWMDQPALGTGRILHICEQILGALSEAHERGIVHRDLKPENMIVTRAGHDHDFLKLLDFGIARIITEGAARSLTREGEVFGTPHYMAPEQAQGKQSLGPQADVYSVGIMMYELFCGHCPFDAPSALSVLFMHINQPLPALVSRPGVEISPTLEAVIRRATAKNADDRYPNAGMMLEALHKAIGKPLPSPSERSLALAMTAALPQRGPWATERQEPDFDAAAKAWNEAPRPLTPHASHAPTPVPVELPAAASPSDPVRGQALPPVVAEPPAPPAAAAVRHAPATWEPAHFQAELERTTPAPAPSPPVAPLAHGTASRWPLVAVGVLLSGSILAAVVFLVRTTQTASGPDEAAMAATPLAAPQDAPVASAPAPATARTPIAAPAPANATPKATPPLVAPAPDEMPAPTANATAPATGTAGGAAPSPSALAPKASPSAGGRALTPAQRAADAAAEILAAESAAPRPEPLPTTAAPTAEPEPGRWRSPADAPKTSGSGSDSTPPTSAGPQPRRFERPTRPSDPGTPP